MDAERQDEEARRLRWSAPAKAPSPARIAAIKSVGIIGAGQMGNGIAHVVALAGYDVATATTSRRRRSTRRAPPSSATWRARSRAASSPMREMQAALKRIRVARPICMLSARRTSSSRPPPRTRPIKRKIFADLCPRLKKSAILATNTSSISITRLASVTDRPERFIGIHFMNPVPMMQLVELIRGIATEDETFAAATQLHREPRQEHRRVGGLSGLHRQPHPAADDQRGGLHALRGRRHGRVDRQGHAARAPTIRWVRWSLPTSSASTPASSVMQVLYEGLADSKYRPCPLLVKYVEAGWLGRKTQRGFYDYRGEKPVPTPLRGPAAFPPLVLGHTYRGDGWQMRGQRRPALTPIGGSKHLARLGAEVEAETACRCRCRKPVAAPSGRPRDCGSPFVESLPAGTAIARLVHAHPASGVTRSAFGYCSGMTNARFGVVRVDGEREPEVGWSPLPVPISSPAFARIVRTGTRRRGTAGRCVDGSRGALRMLCDASARACPCALPPGCSVARGRGRLRRQRLPASVREPDTLPTDIRSPGGSGLAGPWTDRVQAETAGARVPLRPARARPTALAFDAQLLPPSVL